MYSCPCFSPLEKLFLKSWLDTSSTPPRQLAICRASSSFFLSQSRQHLDTWWINQASFLLLVFFFLDRFLTLYLSTLLFLDTCSTDGSTPPRHLICRDLLMVFKYTSCDPQLTSVDLSLIFSDFSSPKPLSLTPNLFPWDSQAFFKSFFTC